MKSGTDQPRGAEPQDLDWQIGDLGIQMQRVRDLLESMHRLGAPRTDAEELLSDLQEHLTLLRAPRSSLHYCKRRQRLLRTPAT